MKAVEGRTKTRTRSQEQSKKGRLITGCSVTRGYNTKREAKLYLMLQENQINTTNVGGASP
jgi:hypothetical protein